MLNAWWVPSQSDEVKPIPWLAPRVIAHLEEIVKPTFRILEHGCGGSTLWFSQRAASVLATEEKQNWRDKINALLDPARARVFGALGELRPSEDLEKFDLLLIDGEPVGDRAQWILNAPQMVKPGGWVVLDNANRPEYAAERAWLKEQAESVETFDGNEGGTRYLVTDFYKMKGEVLHASRNESKPGKPSRVRHKKHNPDVRNPFTNPERLPLTTP